MQKMSGRSRAVREATPWKTAASDLCPESALSFFKLFIARRLRRRDAVQGNSETSFRHAPKPDHIFDLERRQQALEDEIAQVMSHCSTDDPMIADLKRRMLHLKEELERFRHKTIVDRRLH
jgi:hypothetical protein